MRKKKSAVLVLTIIALAAGVMHFGERETYAENCVALGKKETTVNSGIESREAFYFVNQDFPLVLNCFATDMNAVKEGTVVNGYAITEDESQQFCVQKADSKSETYRLVTQDGKFYIAASGKEDNSYLYCSKNKMTRWKFQDTPEGIYIGLAEEPSLVLTLQEDGTLFLQQKGSVDGQIWERKPVNAGDSADETESETSDPVSEPDSGMIAATVMDDIGIGGFQNGAQIFLAGNRTEHEETPELEWKRLEAFLVEEDRVFGNIGFYKDISYVNQGYALTKFQGDLYEEEANSYEEQENGEYDDTYSLKKNGENLGIQVHTQGNHDSDCRSRLSWIVTPDYVYAVTSYGLEVIETATGTVVGQDQNISEFVAEYGDSIYAINKNYQLIRADRITLMNQELMITDGQITILAAGEKFALYTTDYENVYRYDYETNKSEFFESCEFTSYFIHGDCIVRCVSPWEGNDSYIYEVSPFGEETLLCRLEGLKVRGVTEMSGDTMIVSVDTMYDRDWDCVFDSGVSKVNHLMFALNFKKHSAEILGAGFYS